MEKGLVEVGSGIDGESRDVAVMNRRKGVN